MRVAYFTRILISYASEDGLKVAQGLDRVFPQRDVDDPTYSHSIPNYVIFWDYDDDLASLHWQHKLKRYVRWSQFVIVVVTPASNVSGYVQYMVTQAKKYRKKMFFVQVEDTELAAHLKDNGQSLKLVENNFSTVVKVIRQVTDEFDKKSKQFHSTFQNVLGILIVASMAFLLYSIYSGNNLLMSFFFGNNIP